MTRLSDSDLDEYANDEDTCEDRAAIRCLAIEARASRIALRDILRATNPDYIRQRAAAALGAVPQTFKAAGGENQAAKTDPAFITVYRFGIAEKIETSIAVDEICGYELWPLPGSVDELPGMRAIVLLRRHGTVTYYRDFLSADGARAFFQNLLGAPR